VSTYVFVLVMMFSLMVELVLFIFVCCWFCEYTMVLSRPFKIPI